LFVCSSDADLTHLSNALKNYGLAVYRVRRQNNDLTICNHATGEITSLQPMLSYKESISLLEDLIRLAQKEVANEWVSFIGISQQFQIKTGVSLKQIVIQNKLGQKAIHLLHQEPTIFELKQFSNQSTWFVKLIQTKEINYQTNSDKITSRKDLEKAIICLLKSSQFEQLNNIPLEKVASQFCQKYGVSTRAILQSLEIHQTLRVFLESLEPLSVKQIGGKYFVSLRQNTLSDAHDLEFVAIPDQMPRSHSDLQSQN
jgi:hypothetical protein